MKIDPNKNAAANLYKSNKSTEARVIWAMAG